MGCGMLRTLANLETVCLNIINKNRVTPTDILLDNREYGVNIIDSFFVTFAKFNDFIRALIPNSYSV